MAERTTEISFEIPSEEAAVLDGYCQAKGIKRTVVLRRLLREWSDEKHHEAIFIVRVAGSKPGSSGSDRGTEGSTV